MIASAFRARLTLVRWLTACGAHVHKPQLWAASAHRDAVVFAPARGVVAAWNYLVLGDTVVKFRPGDGGVQRAYRTAELREEDRVA